MRIGISAQILAAAVVLVLVLTGLVVREGVARAQGQEVVLEISGYDPRSLLTGHYVQFQIQSDLAVGTTCPPGSGVPVQRPTTWVALRRQGDHHAATGVAPSRDAALKLGEMAVRGDVDCQTGPTEDSSRVVMNLGVDRLHIDQRQAEAVQKTLQIGRGDPATARAIVSVGRDGKARLKGLMVGGKRFDLDWF